MSNFDFLNDESVMDDATVLKDERLEGLYRPTLVVGIGGTGTLVVKSLKKLIQEKFGAEHSELFQLLAIDTEPETRRRDQRLEVNEFLNLAETRIRGDEIIKAMEDSERAFNYQALKSWWPKNGVESGEGYFKPGDIISGAKATRCVGRLALWCRGMDVYRALQRKLKDALQVRGLRRTDIPATGNAAKVFVICSLAGGTGSGMFLDIAYMMRHLLSSMNMTSFITALILTDVEPFREVIREEGLLRRMNANVYAALCELDWFMGGNKSKEVYKAIDAPELKYDSKTIYPNRHYSLQYLSQLHIESTDKPFDVCYLLCGLNEHGRRLHGLQDLTEMMAQEILLEIATPLGSVGRSALDNVERLSAFSLFGDRPMAYSSFAVSSLNFTPELVLGRIKLDLAQRWLRILTNPDNKLPSDLPDSVQEELRELSRWLTDLDIADTLLQKQIENSFHFDFPAVEFSQGVTGQQYLDQARDLHRRTKAILTEIGATAYISISNDFIKSLCQMLDKATHILCRTGQVSLAQLCAYTDLWLDNTIKSQEQINQEVDLANQDAGKALAGFEQECLELEEILVQPNRRWMILSTSKEVQLQGKAKNLLDNLEKWRASSWDSFLWVALATSFEEVRKYLREQRSNILHLQDRLGNLQDRVTSRYRRVDQKLSEGTDHYQLEFQAFDVRDIEESLSNLWNQRLKELVSTAILEELTLVITNDTNYNPGDRILASIDKVVNERYSGKSLIEFFDLIYGENKDQVERQVKRLLEYTAPFWHWTLTDCPDASEWSVISIVGYKDAERETNGNYMRKILEKIMEQHTFVDIYESNRIILLNTKHGLPACALSNMNGMARESYYLYRKAWSISRPGFRPVHLTQEWLESLPDFNPVRLPTKNSEENTKKEIR